MYSVQAHPEAFLSGGHHPHAKRWQNRAPSKRFVGGGVWRGSALANLCLLEGRLQKMAKPVPKCSQREDGIFHMLQTVYLDGDG